MTKTLTIYDKNGNALEIDASLKNNFVGKGYFIKNPMNIANKKKEASNGK